MLKQIAAMNVHAKQRPSALAIRNSEGRSLNWKELVEEVNDRAIEIGKARQPYLIHENHNSIDDVLISLACSVAGVCEVSIDGRFPIESAGSR